MSRPEPEPAPPEHTRHDRRARAGYFGAGVLAAAVPLLALAEKLAEHPAALQVVMDVLRQVGWPGVLVIVGALLLRQQAQDHRQALALIVDRLAEALGKVEQQVAELHKRFGGDSAAPAPSKPEEVKPDA